MPVVERTITIQAPPLEVFRLACRSEDFPRFMPNVQKVTVLAEGEGWKETEWQTAVAGRKLRWTERDEYDEAQLVIRYRQTGGDLKRFEGEWRFFPEDGGTRVELTVDFELGIPMLAALLDPVLIKAVEKNSDAMLQAMQRQLEADSKG